MIPVQSSIPIPSDFTERVSVYNQPLVDYENGGPNLGEQTNDVSYEWAAASDGTSVWVFRENVDPVVVLEDEDISQISFAFDQLMNPHIGYVSQGIVKLYWWDTLASVYETMVLSGVRNPRLCTDEKNPLFTGDRDIIFAYIKGTDLCLRIQRDRFNTEYVFASGISQRSVLSAVCMNKGRRLQFQLVTPPLN